MSVLERERTRVNSEVSARAIIWFGYAFVALLSLAVVELRLWTVAVLVGAAALSLVPRHRPATAAVVVDRQDLVVVAALYLGVVGAFWVAFRGFTEDNVLGLFLSFAAGLSLGVIGPVVYQVWVRGRDLRSLGIGWHNWRATVVMGLVLSGAQFAVTLWGYDMPAVQQWVTLLGMCLVVGLFEAIFFRGFVQGRLEASFGPGPAVAGAAALYAAYHVGYGMGASEMWFLLGLGVLYAVIYRITSNILILWPLLTPLGALFNNLNSGDIDLPWASLAGFADVAALMLAAIWLARRHIRRSTSGARAGSDSWRSSSALPITSPAADRGAALTATPRISRRSARKVWASLWAVLIWLLFVAVTALTVSMWIVDSDYTETTPVTDLSFFALGAMIGAGFTSQIRRRPPSAGLAQSLLASAALALGGLLGSRVEPMAGGMLLTAAAIVAVILHPQPRELLRSHGNQSRLGSALAVLAAAAGIGYATVMLTAAKTAGQSCFLGQCAHGDRLAEMAATALAIPALAALAARRIEGWRLALWSAGLGAITLGATSALLPQAAGSLGVLGGTAALAWGVLLIAAGERDRLHTRKNQNDGSENL